MWLVIGLGNYDMKYIMSRHNIGFLICEHIVNILEGTWEGFRTKNKLSSTINTKTYSSNTSSIFYKSLARLDRNNCAIIAPINLSHQKILFAVNKTYINNCGEPIKNIVDHYSIETSRIIVIHDDVDQLPMKIKNKEKGGSGGHNGIKSLIKFLNTENFHRIKIGVAKPKILIDYYNSKTRQNHETTEITKNEDKKQNTNINNLDLDAFIDLILESYQFSHIDELANISVSDWVLSVLTFNELTCLTSTVDQVMTRIKSIIS